MLSKPQRPNVTWYGVMSSTAILAAIVLPPQKRQVQCDKKSGLLPQPLEKLHYCIARVTSSEVNGKLRTLTPNAL